MNNCIEYFTDFCPSDRIWIIFVFLILVLLGMFIGRSKWMDWVVRKIGNKPYWQDDAKVPENEK